MKRLILIRHAKAEILRYDITDFQRELKKRGERDAKLISKILKDKKIIPSKIISSSAHRALQTAHIFANTLDYNIEEITIKDFLYEDYTTHEFIQMLQKMDNHSQNDTIMIFGHNPSIEYLAFNLLSKFYGEVPTCCAIGIDFDVEQWKNIEARQGKLSLYEFPRKHIK